MAYTDFHWITDRLAVGAFVSAPDDLPFDAILSMETHAPPGLRELASSDRVDYQWRSIIDNYSWEEHDEIVRRFDGAAEQIRCWLEDDRRVLVHCTAGVSRSVSAVVWYLMRYEGMSWDQALETIRSHRAIANPNIRFEIPLRMAAGEELTQGQIRERIESWTEWVRREVDVELDPQEIWDDLERQGTLARAVAGAGAAAGR